MIVFLPTYVFYIPITCLSEFFGANWDSLFKRFNGRIQVNLAFSLCLVHLFRWIHSHFRWMVNFFFCLQNTSLKQRILNILISYFNENELVIEFKWEKTTQIMHGHWTAIVKFGAFFCIRSAAKLWVKRTRWKPHWHKCIQSGVQYRTCGIAILNKIIPYTHRTFELCQCVFVSITLIVACDGSNVGTDIGRRTAANITTTADCSCSICAAINTVL